MSWIIARGVDTYAYASVSVYVYVYVVIWRPLRHVPGSTPGLDDMYAVKLLYVGSLVCLSLMDP